MAQAKSKKVRETVFDVDTQRLATIYAKAALGAAGDDAARKTLVQDLNDIVTHVLDKHPRLELLFDSQLIGEDEKLELLDRLFGKSASPGLLNTLRVMAKHDRLGQLRAVVRSANQLWETMCDQVAVRVQTAFAIDQKLEQEILQALTNILDSKPMMTTEVKPELLGGFVARVGDRVYDASTQTRLEKLRRTMVDHAVDAIETRPQQFFEPDAIPEALRAKYVPAEEPNNNPT
jgi:F-type H+-transporting ATPase subunit delta